MLKRNCLRQVYTQINDVGSRPVPPRVHTLVTLHDVPDCLSLHRHSRKLPKACYSIILIFLLLCCTYRGNSRSLGNRWQHRHHKTSTHQSKSNQSNWIPQTFTNSTKASKHTQCQNHTPVAAASVCWTRVALRGRLTSCLGVGASGCGSWRLRVLRGVRGTLGGGATYFPTASPGKSAYSSSEVKDLKWS